MIIKVDFLFSLYYREKVLIISYFVYLLFYTLAGRS